VVKVDGFKPLALYGCRLESCQFTILSCKEAIQQAYRMYMVLLRFPFMPKIMYRAAPQVFVIGQVGNSLLYDLYSVGVTQNQAKKREIYVY
jgi:hypothetical protein